MSKLNIAIFANAPTPYRVNQHQRLARELEGVTIHSIFPYSDNNQPWQLEMPAEINPLVLGAGESQFGKLAPKRILKDLKKFKPVTDYLTKHDVRFMMITGYNDPLRLKLIRWCRKRSIPVYIFSDSNIAADRNLSPLRQFLKTQLVSRVVKQVAGFFPCGTLGRRYWEKYGGDPASMFDVPHEANYEAIAAVDQQQVEAIARETGLDPSRKYLNYTARLAHVKRADLLIDAFTAIASERPDWDLLMVGGGPLEAELKARVPEHLKDRVTWAGFINGADKLAALYKACDVYVLPSSYEPWAATVIEACACGLALVCSDVVGAAADVVEDGVNGRKFTSGSVESLTACLLEATDPANTERYKQGSATVLEAWRKRSDPVDGYRNALHRENLLPSPSPNEGAPA